ncbi:MAG: hypothetical protein IT539_09925 [Bradyrhizobiaceae bacterium]|nr:hypothetical protein [Bradyrhizobiaceae bacterium]
MRQTDMMDPFAIMQRTFPASQAFNVAARQNATSFWSVQQKLLECMEEFAEGWFERRHDGARSALAAASEMAKAETPFDAMREYQKWAVGSFERVVQDGIACQKQWMEYGRLAVQPIAQAAENTAEASSEATQRQHSRARAA